MKKTIILFLTIALLVSSSGCVAKADVSSEQDKALAATQTEQDSQVSALVPPENFDGRLAGEWVCVSAQENGQQRIVTDDDGTIVLNQSGFGSTYSGGLYGTFWDTSVESSAYKPLYQATTMEGTLLIPFNMEGLDMTIRYELTDIQKSSEVDSIYNNYFAKYDNDQLTLYFTGEYQSSPTNIATIDSTIVFEKQYPIIEGAKSFAVSMIGSWQDSYGNTWQFSAATNESESRLPEVSFLLTDPNGKSYTGKEIRTSQAKQDDPDCVETVGFYFNDSQSSADIHDAKVQSFDGYALSLELENGAQLILNRIS